MIKHVLSEIGGIGLYGAVSIALFFSVFVSAVLWAACMARSLAGRMGRMPLQDGEVETSEEGEATHE